MKLKSKRHPDRKVTYNPTIELAFWGEVHPIEMPVSTTTKFESLTDFWKYDPYVENSFFPADQLYKAFYESVVSPQNYRELFECNFSDVEELKVDLVQHGIMSRKQFFKDIDLDKEYADLTAWMNESSKS